MHIILSTQLISSRQTLPLRQQVLRPFQTIQDCIYHNDDFEKTFHMGGFFADQLVGVATFLEENLESLPSEKSFRLRGMASAPEFQNQGVGRKVLLAGIDQVRNRNGKLLWCNAREIAFPFYEKLGFSYLGPLFEIEGIGPHKVMYKYL